MSDFRPRTSAWQPPPAREGKPWAEDPAARLEQHFHQVWHGAMAGMPFLNEALAVSALPFVRVQGDWVGVVLTPWFLHIYLLPGGGELWQDLAQGLRRKVTLPAGEMDFIGDEDEALGPYQYCVLLAPVPQFTSQEEALLSAREALATLLQPAAPLPGQNPVQAEESDVDGVRPQPDGQAASPARRGFLRGILGRQT